ncbi:MAG: hypothetical protein RLZZ347_230 [Candidatus Parcubacteria bacterium]|jgi:hypothetical protein
MQHTQTQMNIRPKAYAYGAFGVSLKDWTNNFCSFVMCVNPSIANQ